jgi:hypothetical protein
MPTFSETLRAEIEGRLYQISQETGVPYPSLNRFLRGQRGLAVATIDTLCTHLGLVLVKSKSPKPRGKNERSTTRKRKSGK